MRTRTILIILCTGCCGVFCIDQILNIFFSMFPKYALYEKLEGSGSFYNLVFISIALIGLIYLRRKKLYNLREENELNFYITSCVFAFLITLLSYKILLFARASYYFMAITMFSVPYTLSKLKRNCVNFFFAPLVYGWSLLMYFHHLHNNISEIIPYQLWSGEI